MGVGFFFERSGRRLYGFLHSDPAAARRPTGVVLVHPFMEERQDSHPVLRNLAEDLARAGFPTLRFDQYGAGDSAGAWQDGTVAHWVDDTLGAAEVLRERTGVTQIALVGLRFGATLAALAARSLKPSHLCLVQPVVKGETYAQDLLRAHLSAEMVLHKKAGVTRDVLVQRLQSGECINLFGYQLSPAQYQGLCAIDLTRDLAGYEDPVLGVDVVRLATARESKELKDLLAALGPKAVYAKAVEAHSLFTEGKVHYTRAEQVNAAVRAALEA